MPHINELYDFTVTVFIVFGDTVLLVHHPRYDKWLPMGGHIELDEDVDEALFREIEEETGLTVEILSTKPNIESPGTKFMYTPNYIDVHEANPPHKHISFVYFAKALTNHHVKSDEHLAIHWVKGSDLDSETYDLSASVKFYCREALRLAKQSN